MYVGIRLATSHIKCKEDHRSYDATFTTAKRKPEKNFQAFTRFEALTSVTSVQLSNQLS